jgi:K+-transporting ATPase ATPase A chain
MNGAGWLQLAAYMAALLLLTKPLGILLTQVLDGQSRTFLSPVVGPVERLLYRLLRVTPGSEQDWRQYTRAMLVFSAVSMLFTYAILRLQDVLPLNPQGLPPMSPHLAFNTAASFTTNTNWQSYGGESTLSYFSQMVALTFHNFLSAAVGIAVAAVLVRGISRSQGKGLGNFWTDIVRINLHLLAPFCLVFALVLVSQGMVDNFSPYTNAMPIDEAAAAGTTMTTQSIAQGPVASQVAIKMLGTNGGGFMNANASHPFENPNPLSNFLQMLSIFLIPSALTYYLGRQTKNQGHGWAVWAAMAGIFLVAVHVCWWAEAAGNPRLAALGIDQLAGNMEGKEVRFGIFNSALFATITTSASCGAVNSMHDSFTALGGLIPLLMIQLGEVVFGGVGAGLYGILMFVVLAIFIAGLMIGRTPEYLGKKIEAYDVKAAAMFILVTAFSVLGFTAWAAVSDWGVAGLNNAGPHGFSEMLYAYSSGTGNNGSAFAGLTANTPWYNTTLAFAMLFGRFFMILPVMALAGNLVKKRRVTESSGSFPVSGATFAVLLVGTVVIVGALTFLPALALGPVVEHFLMTGSTQVF